MQTHGMPAETPAAHRGTAAVPAARPRFPRELLALPAEAAKIVPDLPQNSGSLDAEETAKTSSLPKVLAVAVTVAILAGLAWMVL